MPSGRSGHADPPIAVTCCDHVSKRPMHRVVAGKPGDGRLLVVLRGGGELRLGGIAHRLRSGSVGLVLPGDPPGALRADPARPYDMLWCRFRGFAAFAIARLARLRLGAPVVADHPRWDRCAATLRRLGTWLPGQVRWRMDGRAGILVEAFGILLEDDAGRRCDRTGFIDYLTRHRQAPLSLEAMAAWFGLPRRTLTRRFRQVMGDSPHRVHEGLRLELVCGLLREGRGVGESAAIAGFADPGYLARVMRRRIGTTPSRSPGAACPAPP